MKRFALLVCLLVGTVAAHAQFEKGKWFVNPSVTGLNLSYDTGWDNVHLGVEAKGGSLPDGQCGLAGGSWSEVE